jgi:predicted deacylase
VKKEKPSEKQPRDESVPAESLAALEAFGGNGEKIFTFEGSKRGPSIFVIGGMHGNELTGIIAAHQLLQALQRGELKVATGSVTLALGNPRAIALNRRYTESKADMNNLFTEDVLTREGDTWEIRRAQKLARTIEVSDIVIDIHSTTNPSVPFIVSRTNGEHERVYRWFSRGAVLEDPNFLMVGGLAMASDYANHKEKISIVFEAGQASDTTKVPDVLRGVLSVFADQGIIDEELDTEPTAAPVFTISESIIFREGFRFVDEEKVHGFKPVQKGEIYAYVNDESIKAPYDCFIVLAFTPEYRRVGRPVCYLAREKAAEGA